MVGDVALCTLTTGLPPDGLTGSEGNPVVHSLLVTVSNHAVLSTQPYNDPCPKDHLLICGEMPME